MKHKGLVAILAAGILLAASGCAANQHSGTETPAKGGSITVGSAYGITQLNPSVITLAFEQTLYPLLWDGLTKQDKSGAVVPDLATKWKPNADATEWTFTLRSGVKFQDGTPLKAEDVVQAFQYDLNPKTAYKYYAKIKTIDKVSAPDDKTVVIHLSQALSVLPLAITDVKIIDVDSLSTINTTPNGTGPFKVKDFVPDDHVTLVRNKNYFGTPPALDEIKIVKVADITAATTALRAGDIDVLYELGYQDAGKFGADKNYTVISADPYHWAQTWKIDTTSFPFNDVRARQALSYATDRKTILQKAYYGFGVAATTNDPVSEKSPYYATSGLTDYSYNLDKASKLFEEAGVHKGDTITWWGPAGIQPEKVATAQILKDSLAKIGINLDIQLKPVAEWTPIFIPVGKSFPGKIAPTGSATPNDPAYIFQFARKGACECNWNDPDFEKAYDSALAIVDTQKRDKAFDKVQQIISEQVPVIVPLVTSVLNVSKSNVKGVWSSLAGTTLHLEDASLAG